MDEAAIKSFLHDQVEAWNAGDRDRFLALYRAASGGTLQIEYVGRGTGGDGWPVLEAMWRD